MVSQRITDFGDDFDALVSQLTNKEICNLILQYLYEKRQVKDQDEFMSPQSFVCWKGKLLLEKEQQSDIPLDGDLFSPKIRYMPPPYAPNFPFHDDDDWWKYVQHEEADITDSENQSHLDPAFNRHY